MTMTTEDWRNHQYYRFDPLADEIQPALLNSVDIKHYVDRGCLIDKSNFDFSRLKTASYEMRFLGNLYDWETTSVGRLKKRCREVCDGGTIELPRNSITYLWMKERLLLPEYIAARFNLHIRHVHKGILLGTGPLVDPGFFGSLLIPLHNLTDNDYELQGGEGVIWVEFTKVSKNEYWLKQKTQEKERPSNLIEFPSKKDLDDTDPYFSKSGVTKAGGVQSAFKGALEKTESAADAARKETARFKKIYTLGGIIAAIPIVLGIAALLFQANSLVNHAVTTTTEINRQIESDRNERSKNTDVLKRKIADLEARIVGYSAEMETLKEQIAFKNERREAGHNLAQ